MSEASSPAQPLADHPEADPTDRTRVVSVRQVHPAPAESAFCAFVPRRVGGFLERFHVLGTALAAAGDATAANAVVKEEFDWATQQSELRRAAGHDPHLALERYRAALAVLADLLGQGWRYRVRNATLELAPPDFTSAPKSSSDVGRQKEAIRASMLPERLAELTKDSTRRFLAEMERPRHREGRELSVLSLVASGEQLAQDLRSVARLVGGAREEALSRVVQPYLQLAADDAECELTGFRLIDLWRYVRYYWSLPYFSTPGRNLFYLIRDAARDFHPIIGIAALGNSMVQLGPRDEWIGWSVEAVGERFSSIQGDARERDRFASAVYQAIDDAISGIDPRGIVTVREIEHPTDVVVRRLREEARAAKLRRVEKLQQHQAVLKREEALGDQRGRRERTRRLPKRGRSFSMSAGTGREQLTLADEAVEELFAHKRAADLADLLRAKRAFIDAGVAERPGDALASLLATIEGRRAVAAAVRATKKQHVGTSMMDIIICGAVPPYTHVLGGKLVCMLLASSQVRADYAARYGKSASHIASRMKGGAVEKPAELVFLGTTSLYHVGSSQYNRVKIPASMAGATGEVAFQELGASEGYGSVQYSKGTRRLLEDIRNEEVGAPLINREFGEGVNPKLRLIRDGLGAIGLNQDKFLRHECRRIVYGVALAKNAREFLRGEATKPDYFFPASNAAAAKRCTAAIADAWRRRWLNGRIDNMDVLERVARCARGALRMSAVAGSDPEQDGTGARTDRSAPRPGGGRPPPGGGRLGVEFIQKLYNHRSCYADRLDDEQLSAIHIETPLERFIVDSLKASRDVVLTGNPGDGKTHLIMRLMPTLEAIGAEHHADATAEESYETVVDAWQRARKRRHPFCLAINEWPLLELVSGYAGRFPALAEVRAQIEHGIVYDGGARRPETVVVIDLNNRNLVDRVVVDRLVTTLISDRFYGECVECPARETCDVPRARRALAADRVRERLFTMLDLVAKRGRHVTMRDLQGFVAYLIAGGRTCAQLIAAQEPRPYYSLAFDGESDLFDAIREIFDPARVTHPAFDEALWAGTLDGRGWLDHASSPAPPSSAPGDQVDAMRAVKRRFFFEHADGGKLLGLLPQDERGFYAALTSAEGQPERLARDLIRLINRFFDPRDDTDAALRLWNRHRYDARWSPTYVSVRSVPIDAFTLLVPRLPPSTAKAHAFQPDHVLLAASSRRRRVAELRVDLSLYRTLFDAQRGLPMALRSPEVLKRLDLFFNALARAFRVTRDIEDVHIKNFETGEDLRFKVDRRNSRYSI